MSIGALKRNCLLLLLIISFFSHPSAAEGQTNEDNADAYVPIDAELPPVVITANRRIEPVDEVTYPITVITREEIVDEGAQSALDALRNAPGISVTSSGSPGDDNDIRIMGSDSDEVLVLVDGVPVNTVLDNRPNVIGTLPAENIDRIEIIEGAQTGMYGSRAVGGVINIITREADKGLAVNAGFKAGNLGRFIEDAGFGLGMGNHRLRINYERWDQAGRFENDRSSQNSVNLNWRYDLAEDLLIQFTPQYYNINQDLAFDSVVEGNFVYYPRDTNRTLRRDTLIVPFSLIWNYKPWWEIYMEYNFFYQFLRLENNPAGDVTPGQTLGDQYARSNEYRNRVSLRNTFTPLDKNGFKDIVTLGFDVDAEHLSFINGPYYGPYQEFPLPGEKYDRQNYAVYVQNVTHFKEYFSLVAGFRYDNNTMFGSELTARGSFAAHIPKSKTTFKFSYSETFNAPLITLYVYNLQPQKETAQNYSVGIEQDLWGMGSLSSFFFYKDYDDFFLDGSDPTGTTDAYAMGVETKLNLHPLRWLNFSGSYTWSKARDEIRDVPLPERPTNLWKAALTVEPIDRLIFRADLSVVGERFWGTNTGMTYIDWRGNVSDGTLDRYVKLDLSGRYTFEWKNDVFKELSLFTAVENVLNQAYEEKYGFPAPGINFLSGFSAKFL